MSVTVLTPATTYRLTTLEAVMAEVPLADQVQFAESLIDQASAAVARYCGTIFAQQQYREVQTGRYCTQMLFLRYWPLVSVGPVLHGTTAMTDYRIESAESAMLYRRDGWWLWHSSAEEWSVDYIAGYLLPMQAQLAPAPPDPLGPELPEDIERATIECIKIWFHERLIASRVESRTLGDQRIDYGIQSSRRGLPNLSQDLLQPWCRMRVA